MGKRDSNEETFYKRRRRCQNCPGCLKPNCNECRNCLDRPINGGSGTLKQACAQRMCLKLKDGCYSGKSKKVKIKIEKNSKPKGRQERPRSNKITDNKKKPSDPTPVPILEPVHVRVRIPVQKSHCSACLATFRSLYARNNHNCVEQSDTVYECNVCLVMYGTKGELDRHLKTDACVVPYTCLYCGSEMLSLSAYQAHTSQCFGDTNRVTHSEFCLSDGCFSTFASETELKEHNCSSNGT